MSMDYRTSTYRPNRPHTRNMTIYGSMSEWIPRHRQQLPRQNSLITCDGRRPILPAAPLGHPTMLDTYINRSSARTPRSSSSRQGRHVHDGIAASHCHVGDGYQHLGLLKLDPSSLRHGRLGGSWKHVKEVMQPGGKRLVFVDGQIAADEHIKSNMAAADVTRSASDLNRVNMVNHAHTGRHRTSQLEQIPVARYDMLDIRRGLERENWNIVR